MYSRCCKLCGEFSAHFRLLSMVRKFTSEFSSSLPKSLTQRKNLRLFGLWLQKLPAKKLLLWRRLQSCKENRVVLQ